MQQEKYSIGIDTSTGTDKTRISVVYPDNTIKIFVPEEEVREAIIAVYDLAGRVQPTIYSTPTKTIQFFRRRLRIAIWKLLDNKK